MQIKIKGYVTNKYKGKSSDSVTVNEGNSTVTLLCKNGQLNNINAGEMTEFLAEVSGRQFPYTTAEGKTRVSQALYIERLEIKEKLKKGED